MRQFLRPLFALCLTVWLLTGCLFSDLAIAATPSHLDRSTDVQALNGNMRGQNWLEAPVEAKLAYCNAAFAAFRGSPSQSYIISANVQSLSPKGLCDRIDRYFSIDENIDTRLSSAAAIAPLLFADTPLGTKYDGNGTANRKP
jgi:hypothetical protein